MSTLMQPTDENSQQFEIIDEQEDTQQDELNSVLSELGVESMDDIMLKVYRINDMGKEAHCFDTMPEGINGIEERLRKSYGRGDYKIKVFAPTPSGGKSIKKHIKLSIEVPNEPEKIDVDNSGEDLKTVVSSMMEAMQQNTKDMMHMFQTSQLESQNSILKFMTESGNKKDDSPSLIEQLTLLKTLMPVPEKVDAMGMLNQMMEMHRNVKEEFSVPEKGNDTMSQLIDGMTGLVDLAKNSPQQQPVQNQQQPSQPSQSGKPAQLENKQSEQKDMNFIVKQKINSHLNFLISKAKDNKNVDVYADLTIEEIPEKFYPQLLGALGENDEQGYTNLLSINANIEPYKEWFIAFCASIRSFFADIDDENLTNDNGSGDDSDIDNNDSDISDTNADKSDSQIPAKSDENDT